MRGIIEPVGPPPKGAIPLPLWRRLLWFGGVALASALSVAAVVYGLRAALFG
jgi:hypothetical protein